MNLDNDLLALGGTLAPCPVPAPVPAAMQVGPGYAAALGQGAASPVWNGGALRLTVTGTNMCEQMRARLN